MQPKWSRRDKNIQASSIPLDRLTSKDPFNQNLCQSLPITRTSRADTDPIPPTLTQPPSHIRIHLLPLPQPRFISHQLPPPTIHNTHPPRPLPFRLNPHIPLLLYSPPYILLS